VVEQKLGSAGEQALQLGAAERQLEVEQALQLEVAEQQPVQEQPERYCRAFAAAVGLSEAQVRQACIAAACRPRRRRRYQRCAGRHLANLFAEPAGGPDDFECFDFLEWDPAFSAPASLSDQ
jgi:hypothetical protein